MERVAPHLIAHLGDQSLSRFFEEFHKLFADGLNAVMDSSLGTVLHLGNLRIAEIVQRIEQEPLPLGVGTERQNRQNFIQRFPLADQFLWGGAVGQAALGGDYVLVIFAPVPIPLTLPVEFPIVPLGLFQIVSNLALTSTETNRPLILMVISIVLSSVQIFGV
jgi:hypothetical protein